MLSESKQRRETTLGRIHMPILVSFIFLFVHWSCPCDGTTTNAFHLVPPPFFHRIWQFEDGLPSPLVRAVMQTQNGYLLVATDEGLAKFDGIRFHEIEHKTIPGKAQRWFVGVIQRKDGSIWSSSVDGGVVCNTGGVITRYTTNNSSLPNDYVLSIFEDSKTNLWIGSAGGLSLFTNGNFLNLTNRPGLIVEATRSIAEDQNGNLWFGTAKGLSRFDGKEFTSFTTNDFLLNNAVYFLMPDRRGGLWIATAGGLTYWIEGKARQYTEKEGLAHNSVRAVCEDSRGRVWIGSQSGLQLFENGTFHSVRLQSVTDPGFQINSIVYSICEDRERNIWVGTSLGLNQVRDQPIATYSKEEGLPSEVVTSICQGTKGTIWIGTYGGLSRIKGSELTTFTAADGLSTDHIVSLAIEEDGTVWVGTDSVGLSRFKKGKFTNFSSRDPKMDAIRAIYVDDKKDLWLGDNAGAHVFKNGKWLRPLLVGLNTVKGIVQDQNGTYWFAGDDSLKRFSNSTLTNLREKLGFSAHTANSVLPGKDGDLFVGTDDGLFYFFKGQFHLIKAHPELQHRRVYQIVEDDAENIWLSTQTGILSIPKRELRAHVLDPNVSFSLSSFGKPEGMRRAQCNGIGSPSAVKTQDGRIWFATLNGVAVIEAKNFQRNTNPPPVEIEEVIIDGKLAAFSSVMELPPGKGHIEIIYTALSLRAPEKVRFQYQLEGVDAGWIDAGNRRVARYSNLAPGNYHFTVRACNNDGIWNKTGASFSFTLQKHFYQTLWFGALCIGVAGSLIGLTVVGRVRAGRNREAELQREIARRTEKLEKSLKTMESFNYSIAHDLRGPLRAIKGLTEALQEDYSGAFDEAGRDYSHRIKEAVDRMDHLIADLLAFGSISHKNIVCAEANLDTLLPGILSELKTEITAKKAIVHLKQPLGSIWANEVLLQQILLNLISNGLKFVAPGVAPELHIWTEQLGPKMRIHVRDNGIGIAKEHHQKIFGVFERLHSTSAYPGTGIGLAIVTKAAERMEGVVGLESAVGKGSCFWIELPVPKAGR